MAKFVVQDEVYCPLTYTIDYPTDQTFMTQVDVRSVEV